VFLFWRKRFSWKVIRPLTIYNKVSGPKCHDPEINLKLIFLLPFRDERSNSFKSFNRKISAKSWHEISTFLEKVKKHFSKLFIKGTSLEYFLMENAFHFLLNFILQNCGSQVLKTNCELINMLLDYLLFLTQERPTVKALKNLKIGIIGQ